MANYSANDVANWFLSKGRMSPKKLQKLVYYAYSWVLVFHNENAEELNNRLFDDEIEAWVHGPVVRSLYYKYSSYGFNDIHGPEGEPAEFPSEIEATLNEVWEAYGSFNGNQLESLTHEEEPWLEAREGLKPMDASDQALDDETIFNFYSRKMVV